MMNGQSKTAVAILSLLLTAGCGNLTERERNTAIGAGLGGVAGSVLSGGDTGGAVGGAVVGGVIGNQIKK